jgi:hypothetical protein
MTQMWGLIDLWVLLLFNRRGEVAPVPRWDAEDYEAVEQNLEGLTADIPDMPLGEVPRRYQCHTVGVSESVG